MILLNLRRRLSLMSHRLLLLVALASLSPPAAAQVANVASDGTVSVSGAPAPPAGTYYVYAATAGDGSTGVIDHAPDCVELAGGVGSVGVPGSYPVQFVRAGRCGQALANNPVTCHLIFQRFAALQDAGMSPETAYQRMGGHATASRVRCESFPPWEIPAPGWPWLP